MERETERTLVGILETVMLLKPVTVRLAINENVGLERDETLTLLFAGRNGNELNEIDFQFYRIMRTQKMIYIPSVSKSRLLSNLNFGEGSAIFYPLQVNGAYVGCMWVFFLEKDFNESIIEKFTSLCEWMEFVLQKVLPCVFSAQMLAAKFKDILELIRQPALIYFDEKKISISNTSFEKLKQKDAILKIIREGGDILTEMGRIDAQIHVSKEDIEYSTDKKGDIFVFTGENIVNSQLILNKNEFDYYEMLIQKAAGNLDLLDSSGALTLLQYNYKETIDNQLRRLEKMISLARKHYANFGDPNGYTFEVLVISDLLKDVIFDIKSISRNKKIEIELSVEKVEGNRSPSGNAIGDAWLLTLMMFNLVSNAIRFSKPDGKPIQVELRYRMDHWALRVQDFGIGISPLDIDDIRKDDVDEFSVGEIHGIKLVKYVVKLHKGKINIDSKLGKGATFEVEIPYY